MYILYKSNTDFNREYLSKVPMTLISTNKVAFANKLLFFKHNNIL